MSTPLREAWKSPTIATLLGFAVAATMQSAASAQATPKEKIPDLGSSEVAWLITVPLWQQPGGGLRGPIMADPMQTKHDNQDGPGQVTPRVGNWRDPVLKAGAAGRMRLCKEEVLSGKRG